MPYYFLLGFVPLEKTVTSPSSMGWFHTGEYLHHQPYYRFWGPPESYVEMHLLWACLPNWRGSPVYFLGVCNLLLPLVSVCGTAGCLVLQLASVLSPALEIQSVPISSGEAETSLSLGGSHPKSWKFTHTFYLLFPS